MKIANLYQAVTASIIADLVKGSPPWLKCWKGDTRGSMLPVNCATQTHYHGINIPILWQAASEKGYPTHEWLTFKQALAKGACVRQGEKSTHVVFVKRLTFKKEDSEETTQGSMLKAYSVFNRAQVDGLPEPEVRVEVSDAARHAGVEAFIAATQASIHHGGDMPCYVPLTDYICMPRFESFKGAEHYYATALHELSHWSGAKHRLNRDMTGRFGSRSYAAEELVAELSAAFLCAHLGIEGDLRHAGYIQTWIQMLKDDPRAIFTAASKASQAADFLRDFSEEVEEEEPAVASL